MVCDFVNDILFRYFESNDICKTFDGITWKSRAYRWFTGSQKGVWLIVLAEKQYETRKS